MKYINGLYGAFILMFIINVSSTTIFGDKYCGITAFISLGILIIGIGFYVNARRLFISDKE